jgi:hypothetical protein
MVMFLPEYPVVKSMQYLYKTDFYSSKLQYSLCRIVFRNPVTNLKSDMNGLDLYTSSVLGTDRYEVAQKLFNLLSE